MDNVFRKRIGYQVSCVDGSSSLQQEKDVDKHAPLKTTVQRGNTAPFMNQQLQKAIYTRSRLKKRLNKNPTAENRTKFKKQRNKCVSIRKKAIKSHFKEATKNGTMSNKEFWDLVKPFLSNKGGLTSSDISLVKNENIVTDDKELTEIFNDHYVNIVPGVPKKSIRIWSTLAIRI